MFTRKHFISAARMIRESRVSNPHNEAAYRAIEDNHVRMFSESNPRFDEARFRKACNPREVDHAIS